MRTSPQLSGRSRRAGFTVMEMVAVLVIIATMAGIAASSALARLKQGFRDRESIALGTLAGAVTNVARTSRYLPSTSDWAATLAAQLAYASGQISSNANGYARAFLVDPSVNLTLPYTQTGAGLTSAPANLRFIFLSSVSAPLPSLTSISFDTLWNTSPNALPTGWPSAWKGEVSDLLIRRVDLRGLFQCLVLNNLDAVNAATWKIDGASSTLTLPVSSQKIAWYIDGSFLTLYDRYGALFLREVLKADTSYTYQWAEWDHHLTRNGQAPTDNFGQTVDDFLAMPAVPADSSRFGADQQAVVDEMLCFLRSYGLWGMAGFPSGGSSSDRQVPEFRQVNDSQARLDSFSYNLIK